MASLARDRFIAEAHRLSHAAPQFWKEFEAAFTAYAASQVEAAVQAPVTHALTSHGIAQAYLALRDDFQKLEQIYSAIEQKYKNKSR